ncbi:MAG: alpha-galactosidase, partial [Ruminococcus sp.]|nr:alpha-galactosidase [Ruminococcus sp.]
MTGYPSWYRHYQDINEEKLSSDLEALNGGDIFQIDDGWQTAVGDWLSVDKQKFPEGMKVIADRIREKGYIPGIWMAPFVCEKDSVMFAEHPDWLLK